jgi:hypothetical protein
MAKRLPTEFGINMNLEKMMVLQQAGLQYVNQANYFDIDNPCHLYFICKRPRISLNIDKFEVTKKHILFTVNIHNKGKFEEREYKVDNFLKTNDIKLISEYPFNFFQLVSNNQICIDLNLSVFLQTISRHFPKADFLDLEVLYIGQSYGVEGARTAPDRLKNHSTLQGIYAEAITNNPDCEIWLALMSFSQNNIMIFNGRTNFSEEEYKLDDERRPEVIRRLMYEGINEQQKINFTEAALIKYFQPIYNKTSLVSG